jgi:hypothetical protein
MNKKYPKMSFFKPVKLNTKSSVRKIPLKTLTWPQASIRFPRLNPFGDKDRDGKLNMFDCRPFDPFRHGNIKTNRITRLENVRKNKPIVLVSPEYPKVPILRHKDFPNTPIYIEPEEPSQKESDFLDEVWKKYPPTPLKVTKTKIPNEEVVLQKEHPIAMKKIREAMRNDRITRNAFEQGFNPTTDDFTVYSTYSAKALGAQSYEQAKMFHDDLLELDNSPESVGIHEEYERNRKWDKGQDDIKKIKEDQKNEDEE